MLEYNYKSCTEVFVRLMLEVSKNPDMLYLAMEILP